MGNSDRKAIQMALAKPRETQPKEKDGVWEISRDGKGREDRRGRGGDERWWDKSKQSASYTCMKSSNKKIN